MPILMFCAEHDVKLDHVVVDLMAGAHMQEDFIKINPMHRVPLLQDADLTLSECSAILKYLAEKSGAPVYPKDDLQMRARINERMDARAGSSAVGHSGMGQGKECALAPVTQRPLDRPST
jgi:glutathione S-transferase